jgi:GT2 family glycosyltransferase
MDISVIVVSHNTKELTLGCLASLFETIKGIAFEVWVVDNNSTDATPEAIRERYPTVALVENKENVGFGPANNQALRRMNGRYALLLNTDTRLTDGAARELYDFMEAHLEAGMACGQLLNEDGSKQNSIANFPSLLALLCNESLLRVLMPGRFPSKRREYRAPLRVDSCIGACLIVRKQAMDDIGLLDERYFFFMEETDWAYRMKRGGWDIYFVPTARTFHAQGRTVGHGVDSRIMFYRSRYSFFGKWHPRTYPALYALIFLRLVANMLLSVLGVLVTLGLKESIRRKSLIYVRLLLWHLQGCPERGRVGAG